MAALLGIYFFSRLRPWLGFASTLILWVALGAFRYAADTQLLPSDHISQYLQEPIEAEIFGRVVDLPDRRDKSTNLVLDVRRLTTESQQYSVSGRILVRVADTSRHFSYGDYLQFSGWFERPHLARNPGGFDYHRYLRDRGISGTVSVGRKSGLRVYPDPGGALFYNRLIIPLREYILHTFRKYLPGPTGTLLAGYIIGETREMPDDVYNAYRRSGTLHLLAVSGSNVWLVLGLFWLVFRALRLPRLLQTGLLLLSLVVFCFVTRNDPSVVRAGLMAALVLLGQLFHRRLDLLNIAGASAVVILLFSPHHLFLPGFQLSYAAVLGILVLTPPLYRLVPARWKRSVIVRWVVGICASSVAATAATAPILALHFAMIPVVSVLANLVMVPLAGLVTYGAVLLVLIGDFWPAGARFVALLVKFPAAWSIGAAHFFEHLPIGQLRWAEPGVFAVGNYFLVLAAFASARTWYRWLRPVVFYALLVALIVVGGKLFARPTTGEVMFFDAGYSRLVGLHLPGQPVRFIGGRGAFSSDNREWIIEPFLNSGDWPTRPIVHDTLTAARAVFFERGEVPISRQLTDDHLRWQRYLVSTDSAGAGTILADCFDVPGGGRLVILYNNSPALYRRLVSGGETSRRIILALPYGLPSADWRETLTSFPCTELVLYGGAGRLSSAAARTAWLRWFPAMAVRATAVDGGILLRLDNSLQAVSTVR